MTSADGISWTIRSAAAALGWRSLCWSPQRAQCAGISNSGTCPCRGNPNLDLFWLKDDSLLDSDNLPDPDAIAAEIADGLRSALEQMEAILGDLPLGDLEEAVQVET